MLNDCGEKTLVMWIWSSHLHTHWKYYVRSCNQLIGQSYFIVHRLSQFQSTYVGRKAFNFNVSMCVFPFSWKNKIDDDTICEPEFFTPRWSRPASMTFWLRNWKWCSKNNNCNLSWMTNAFGVKHARKFSFSWNFRWCWRFAVWKTSLTRHCLAKAH